MHIHPYTQQGRQNDCLTDWLAGSLYDTHTYKRGRTYIHTYIQAYMQAYNQAYTRTHNHTCIRKHIQAGIHIHTGNEPGTHAETPAYIHTGIHNSNEADTYTCLRQPATQSDIYPEARMHTYRQTGRQKKGEQTYIHTHTCIQAYIHTYTHTDRHPYINSHIQAYNDTHTHT